MNRHFAYFAKLLKPSFSVHGPVLNASNSFFSQGDIGDEGLRGEIGEKVSFSK